jgi:hypothetical protein
MQIKTPPPVHSVVKREDKMEIVRTFVKAFLLMPRAASADSVQEITLVARSAESPVARALASLGADIASRGLTVRAIFGYLECEKSPVGWSIAGPEIPFNRQLRWAKNPRLADAHEQLVLGPQTAWIGDCLRRDPSRRDAYEQYVTGDARTATTLHTSFARLWTASVPLLIRTPKDGKIATAAVVDHAALASLAPCDDNSGPLISSPH